MDLTGQNYPMHRNIFIYFAKINKYAEGFIFGRA